MLLLVCGDSHSSRSGGQLDLLQVLVDSSSGVTDRCEVSSVCPHAGSKTCPAICESLMVFMGRWVGSGVNGRVFGGGQRTALSVAPSSVQ